MSGMTPDTSLALMQAAQGQNAQSGKAIKNAGGVTTTGDARLDAVAEDFEAMFIAEMMKPMFAGIKPDPMFGGGKGEEVFQGMMLQEYGKLMAQTGQLGIAEAVKQEMIRMQAAQDGQEESANTELANTGETKETSHEADETAG